MRKFTVTKKNLTIFLSMMNKMDKKSFGYHTINRTSMKNCEVTFMDKIEKKDYIKTLKQYTIKGQLYIVRGGVVESRRYGHTWYYEIGEVIKCVSSSASPFGVADFESTTRDKGQCMTIPHLQYLIVPYNG